MQRQQDLLTQARLDRQAIQAKALRKARRRACRAERQLEAARSDVARLRGELDSRI